MRVDKPTVDKGVDNVHAPLAGQTRGERTVLALRSSYLRKILEENSSWSYRHHNSQPWMSEGQQWTTGTVR
jgi:hypothetical protein